VDDFFTAATRIQENTNPSGTAAARANYLNALKIILAPVEAAGAAASGHPWIGVGAAGAVVAQDVLSGFFARAMYHPRVVQLLTEGMQLPGGAMAARAKNLAAISAILRSGEYSRAQGAGPGGSR
jgi:hypothetical protein